MIQSERITNWLDVASALRRYAAWMAKCGHIEWGPDFFRDDSLYATGLAQRLEMAFRKAAHLTR